MRATLLFLLLSASTQAASVAGLTVDAFTGEPIAGVNVKLRSAVDPTATREARSDETGRFAFSDLKGSSYYPFAELEGYHRVSEVVRSARIDGINVKAGDRVEGVRVLIARDAVISGRVLDENGAPIQGARVEAWPVLEDHPKIVREGKGDALTNADGEYLYVVTPGEYMITALAPWPRWLPESGVRLSQGFLFTSRHEPGGITVEAVPIVETKHVDIELHLKTGLTISGKVSGIPTGDGRCDLYIESGRSLDALNYTRFYTFKSADKFELNDLHAGFYRVYARFWGSTIPLHSQVLEFNLDSKNGRGLELILAPHFSITGVVEAEHGRPLGHELYIRGRSESSLSANSRIVQIHDDGTFEIPDLIPDRYELQGEPRSWYYIKRVMLGDTELKDGILDLGRGAPGATLKVVLGEMSASLTLKLVDRTGRPISEGNVLIVPDGRVTQAECVMGWSSSTSIGWDGLAPGRYRIIWIFEPFPGTMDADRIRDLAKDAELVEIQGGERLVRTLRQP